MYMYSNLFAIWKILEFLGIPRTMENIGIFFAGDWNGP